MKFLQKLFGKRKHSVYVVWNKKNNKKYIGMTNSFKRRKSEHFDEKYRKKHKDKFLYIEMKKDGIRNYKMKPLQNSLTKNEALYMEASLINKIPTYNNFGYNVAKELKNLKLKIKNKQQIDLEIEKIISTLK